MPERRSLYHKYPDYRVDLEPIPDRVRVRVDGELIVDTTRALALLETRHDPASYVPFEDVRADVLEPSPHTSFCPFKGEARYWSVRVGGRLHENVMWGYPDPFEEAAGIAKYVAFYPDRVEWIVAEEED